MAARNSVFVITWLLDKTAMVKVMDALILLGYIEKKINPRDRREHFVSLTKKGNQAH